MNVAENDLPNARKRGSYRPDSTRKQSSKGQFGKGNTTMYSDDYDMFKANTRSQYRNSGGTDAVDAVPMRQSKGRSQQTHLRSTSATFVDEDADVQRTSTVYTLNPSLDEAEQTFYGTTGVCIDEKVLKQISENQTKFMQDRITSVERHFGNLCEAFGGYARALCKVRDSGDRLAKDVMSVAMDEKLNPTMKDSLEDFASHFSAVQDYEESEVRKIEEKVVKPLTNYGTSCKQAKERLKKACIARNKELKQKSNLEKTKEQRPYDTQHISKAQTNLQKASVNALRAHNEVEQEIQAFERKKLDDIKQIMTDFVGIEMFYHIRALEQLSKCSKSVATMNVNVDLEQFLNYLRPLSAQSRIAAQRGLRELRTAEDSGVWSTQSSAPQQTQKTTQQNMRTSTHQQSDAKRQTMSRQVEIDDDDDEEEEEDDDEDEEEESDDDDEDEEENSIQAIPIKAKPAIARPVISS